MVGLNYIKNNKVLLISVLVFMFAFFSRVYFISIKSGVHIDEIYTMTISSCKYGERLNADVQSEHVYTGKEVKELLEESPKNLKETTKDLTKLWFNSCGDYSGPNLYYIIFKMFSFPAKHFDLKTLIHYETGLNLVIFCFSFLVMYKLLCVLFRQKPWVVPVGLFFAFMNTGAISNALFGRMYELQSFSTIFMAYALVLFCKKLDENKNIFPWKTFSIYIFSSLIGLLSGYFMVIYFLILSFYILVKVFRTRNASIIFQFVLGIFLIVLFLMLAYPSFFLGLTHPRVNQISSIFIKNIYLISLSNAYYSIVSYMKYFLFYVPVLLILGLCLFFWKNKQCDKLAFHLLFMGIFWMSAVSFLSHEKLFRYIMPIFQILSLVFPIVLSCLEGMKKYILAGTMIVIYSVYLFNAKSVEFYTYFMQPEGYKFFEPKSDLFSSHIENLYLEKPEFVNHPEIPVVVEYSGFWTYLGASYLFNDKQIYLFHKREGNFGDLDTETLPPELTKYKKYYLMIGHNTMDGPWFRGFKGKNFMCLNIFTNDKMVKAIKSGEVFQTLYVYLIDFN